MAEKAALYLKEHGYDAVVDEDGILVIPFDYVHEYPDKFYSIVTDIRRLLCECGYKKSWKIDPFYYSHLNEKETNYESNKE